MKGPLGFPLVLDRARGHAGLTGPPPQVPAAACMKGTLTAAGSRVVAHVHHGFHSLRRAIDLPTM